MTMSGDSDLPHLDMFVDEKNAEESVISIAKKVRPDWNDKDIKAKVFSGGISNKLLGCYLPPNKDDVLLSRIYGKKTELLVDRQREKDTFKILHKAGCGPKLHASFQNGICYDFVPGVTLDEKTVREEKIYKLVARELAGMHLIQTGDGTAPSAELFDKTRNFISLHPDHFEDPKKEEIFKTRIMSRSELNDEVKMLVSVLTSLDAPVVFSHNDLLLGNIIYNEEKNKVCFIDYEYAMYNYLPFDIANHFCEFPGIEEVNYDLYPSKEFQLQWIKEYLSARYSRLGENKVVTDREVERMYAVVNKFALASHFFWGVWAIVQAYHSTIDFDFLDYAIIRLDEYKRRKTEFLALPIPE
ncbi:ethanolamine kinase 1 [Strongylocentrotus purpuratus]|uniref:ethanolamine kinase n=1 Tax=Strongylocentrotus purpuratus TaxID=7668 RepID=A0A7M7P1U5_STRPU|nr:ethanolamine kinase 1 [Strongylocentrotus purpuratus]